MKIRFQNNLEQIKKVREVVKDMQEAEKLAECVNHWSDDDSWGGSFGTTEWTPDRIYNDWFINLKAVALLVVDEDGTLQGYIDIDHHFEDDDTIYAGLLGVYLYLQPIDSIFHLWNNDLFVGKQTSQQRGFITTVPHNWVIVDWANNKLKALFASTNPRIRVHGEYTNSNNYSELISNSVFTLAPGDSKQHDVILIFSKDLEELKAFKQRQQVVRL